MNPTTRKMFKSRDARTKLRGMGGILASSPELAQTVQQFQDGGNVDGGFGSNIEYTYSTFLAENNLNDTPQAREMFARYKVYMDTREAPSSPKLFNSAGFNRAPMALGDAPMTSAVEFDPSPQFSRPDMPSAPASLSALSVEPDAAYTRQTSPAAPAAPMSSGAPVIDTSIRRDNVDLAYGGSGGLYQKGIAGQMSAVRSLGDGEILSIVGDPSNSLYGAAVEEMANRRMDFGEKPVIAAQKISREAERRLFAAQEQLRAATTPTETIAAEAAIRDAEAGVQEATLNQENTPRSVLEPAVDLTPSELLAQELGMDYVPGSETPVVEAPAADTATETPVVEVPAAATATETPAADTSPETGTGTAAEPAAVVTEEVVKKVADPKIQKKAAELAPNPDDTEDDLRTKYEARAKLFREILGEDEAGARNKGMDLAMIGLAIMSGQSPNALTNIAQGGAAGLQAMSARDEAARERQRLVRTSALESVLDEEAASTAAAATAAEKERDRANARAVAQIRNSAARTSLYADDDRTYEVAADAARARASDPLFPPDDFLPGDTIESYAKRAGDSAVRLKNESKAAGFGPSGDSPSGSGASIRTQIQSRVDAVKDNPAALAAIKQSLISKGIDPSTYGIK